MPYLSLLILFFSAFTFCTHAVADPRPEPTRESSGKVTPLCVNDKFAIKDTTNFDIIESMTAAANEPMLNEFNQHSRTNTTTTSKATCTLCLENRTLLKSAKDMITWTQDLLHVATPLPAKIKKECIEASLQREINAEGFSCSNGQPKAFSNTGNTPCLDQKSSDYIHFAINMGLNCLSSVRGSPLDSRYILKKINTETAFNFFLANRGGKGIGQLTGILVDDMSGVMKKDRSGKEKLVPGRGSYILEALADSKNPACAPFKNVALADSKKAPPEPGIPKNYCSWLSPGDGLTRNLMYTLGYYAFLQDKVITPFMKRNAPALAKDPDFINYMTMIAYGPDGTEEAFALVSTLRLKKQTNAKIAIDQLIQRNAYLASAEDRMDELLGKRDGHVTNKGRPNYSDSDKKGNSCVQ